MCHSRRSFSLRGSGLCAGGLLKHKHDSPTKSTWTQIDPHCNSGMQMPSWQLLHVGAALPKHQNLFAITMNPAAPSQRRLSRCRARPRANTRVRRLRNGPDCSDAPRQVKVKPLLKTTKPLTKIKTRTRNNNVALLPS